MQPCQDHLQRVRRAAQNMATLIDDMLNLSRVSRSAMRRETLDLSNVAKSIAAELQESDPDRKVDFVIEGDLTVAGDLQLLRAAMGNLLRNAWKYTSRHTCAKIEFGRSEQNGKSTFLSGMMGQDLIRVTRTVSLVCSSVFILPRNFLVRA